MAVNQLKQYLKALSKDERERLVGAVSKEIVEAGKAAGYRFGIEDVAKMAREFSHGPNMWGG